MLVLFPYRVEALYHHTPVANWVLIVVTCTVSLVAFLAPDTVEVLVLERGSLFGMIGHLFLHGSLDHLAGNMFFLWIFGNIISANMTNVRYVTCYLVIGLLAGLVHLVLDGSPAVGASGAINGIVGMTVAAYPRDRVHAFWLFFVRWGTTSIRLWVLVLVWLTFDLWGAFSGEDNVAYWSHIGGLLAGLGLGLLALANGWIYMTIFDRRTLLEIFGGPRSERKP